MPQVVSFISQMDLPASSPADISSSGPGTPPRVTPANDQFLSSYEPDFPFMSSLDKSHSICSDTETQLRDGLASWPFYATALPSSIWTLRAHAAGVVWLEHGTSGVTVKVLDAVTERERQTLLHILDLGSVPEPSLRIMEALDDHSPCLALLRGQADQDP